MTGNISLPSWPRIEQGTEDRWPRQYELPPKLAFGTPLFLADRIQRQKDRPVGQVRSTDNIKEASRDAGGGGPRDLRRAPCALVL